MAVFENKNNKSEDKIRKDQALVDANMLFENQMFKFSEFLLEDKSMDDKMFETFWAFTDKEGALTNLNETRVKKLMRAFDNTVFFNLMTRPAYNYTFKDEMNLQQLRAKTTMKLLRSTGGRDRERFILGSQIQQNIIEDQDKPQPKGGIVGGVKKMFGMR